MWRTEETLWRDVTLRSPRNGRGLMNYSLTQLAIGRTDLALTYFLRAAVFNPSYYVLEINTAIAYSVLGYTAEAEKHFTRATRKNRHSAAPNAGVLLKTRSIAVPGREFREQASETMDSHARSERNATGGLVKPRNLNLDVLRGIAVLLVLGRHFEYFPRWTAIGWAGVDLFFVLSGFLISGLLFKEWKQRGNLSVSTFYIRRAFKIYPSFYVFLSLTSLIPLFGLLPYFRVTSRPFLITALFWRNYFPADATTSLWGHSWSLAVEEHFYIVLPVLLWLMQLRRSRDPFRPLLVLVPAIAVLVLILRYRAGWDGAATGYEAWLLPTHLRMDSLFFGVLLSYLWHFHSNRFAAMARSPFSLIPIAAAIEVLFIYPLESAVMHTFGFTVLYLGFGFLLVMVVDLDPGKTAVVFLKPIARIGVYSYSIYLWHLVVGAFIPQMGFWRFVLYIGLSIGTGAFASNAVEFGALRLRDRWFPSRVEAPRYSLQSPIFVNNVLPGPGTELG